VLACVGTTWELHGNHMGAHRYSSDHGRSWTNPVPAQAPATPGAAATMFAVWPQLLALSNGALVLASGRSGIGFWVSPKGDGADWVGSDVAAFHSRNLPSDPCVVPPSLI
jgi:hypothetical protein